MPFTGRTATVLCGIARGKPDNAEWIRRKRSVVQRFQPQLPLQVRRGGADGTPVFAALRAVRAGLRGSRLSRSSRDWDNLGDSARLAARYSDEDLAEPASSSGAATLGSRRAAIATLVL